MRSRRSANGAPAALIVEPLILGAGGMLIYGPAVLAGLKRICEAYGVLFIADEVMTGFGRTGTLFACEQAGISPDILCLAKGLTVGVIPLAATLCRREIFEAHLSPARDRMFFHSSSFTANPIACAAAAANLDVWAREPVRERIAALVSSQTACLEPFKADERFSNVRQLGTITALDLNVPDAGYLADAATNLYNFFAEKGMLLRPLGNTVYVMPPYCTGLSELEQVYAAIAEAPGNLKRIAQQKGPPGGQPWKFAKRRKRHLPKPRASPHRGPCTRGQPSSRGGRRRTPSARTRGTSSHGKCRRGAARYIRNGRSGCANPTGRPPSNAAT